MGRAKNQVNKREDCLNKKHSNPVPPETQAEIDALAALPENQLDTDDIPEVHDWSGAKRGLFYRPVNGMWVKTE
jgi:hypothetical protein